MFPQHSTMQRRLFDSKIVFVSWVEKVKVNLNMNGNEIQQNQKISYQFWKA